MNFFTTRHILKEIFLNMSDFKTKLLERVIFWIEKNTTRHVSNLKNATRHISKWMF